MFSNLLKRRSQRSPQPEPWPTGMDTFWLNSWETLEQHQLVPSNRSGIARFVDARIKQYTAGVQHINQTDGSRIAANVNADCTAVCVRTSSTELIHVAPARNGCITGHGNTNRYTYTSDRERSESCLATDHSTICGHYAVWVHQSIQIDESFWSIVASPYGGNSRRLPA